MKVSWSRWVTIVGKPPKRWQKPFHGNLHARVRNHAFNLTLAPNAKRWKVCYSHLVKSDDNWKTKTSKNWF